MNGTFSFYECRFSGWVIMGRWGHSNITYAKEFELFALTGNRGAKTLDVNTHAIGHARATWWNFQHLNV